MAEEQIIIEVVVDNAAARKNIEAQTSDIVSLENEIKRLQVTQKELNSSNKQNSKAYKENAELIALNKSELKSANSSRQDSIKTIGLVNNSLNAQKAALKANKIAIGNVNTATRAGQKEYKRLNKEILNQTNSLKKAEQAQGTFTRGVGDYGQALSAVNPAMGGAASGFQAMTKGALAFIATPIGAVIGVLGLAIGALTEYFNGSEEGQNALLGVTNKLSGVFSVLSDVVQSVGKAIFEAVSSPKETIKSIGEFIQQNLINRFEGFLKIGDAVVKIFKGDFKEGFEDLGDAALQAGTGVENLIGKTQDLIDKGEEYAAQQKKRFEENERRSNQITILQTAQAENERRVLVRNAKIETKIAELRLKAKKEDAFSAQERIGFLKEAGKLTDEQIANELTQAGIRLQIARTQNAQGKSKKEEKLAEAQAEADFIRLEEKRANAKRKLETEIQTNIKKSASEQAKADKAKLDATKKQEKAELDYWEKIAEARKKTDEYKKEQAAIEQEAEEAAQVAADEAETASAQKSIDDAKKVADIKIGLASDVAGAVASFAEQGSVLAKAAGIAQIGINTATSIIAAFSTVGVPPPIQFAQAAVVGSIGAAQAAKVAGLFEDGGEVYEDGGLMKGGMFKGASHKDGGIKFRVGGKIHEAEGGEAIISKRATAMFKPQLSAMNVAGGGKKFASGGVALAGSSTAGIDSAMASEQSISNQLKNQAPMQVAVTDINRTQSNVSVKQNRATI